MLPVFRRFPAHPIRCVVFFLLSATALHAQVPAHATGSRDAFIRTQTFGLFFAYSNDSSHILLGYAENRKLLNIGATYGRRIWAGKVVNWQYHGEIMPVALESDPVDVSLITETSSAGGIPISYTQQSEPVTHCVPGPYVPFQPIVFNGITYTATGTITCSRRWTIGEGMMPVGFQWNFIPHHRIQPYLVGHGGYMYSSHSIPVQDAGHFNFAFDFGAGLEIFRNSKRSLRLDYRYHHISNHNTAPYNPGIDNGLAEITYCFGR